ncbi:hypothetical protein ZIOFF_066590 [Zingiber officinale]|uniref:Uncharacterized protein n=1 Tax=Zingiber officinale TaxID=94328 RepID=A0A8J5EYM6_ZINOF|nr:hypothetical protein ZIOFF_066590 [Zingiber officinale]
MRQLSLLATTRVLQFVSLFQLRTIQHTLETATMIHAKLVALLASFILRKPLEKPSFEKVAIKTLESISNWNTSSLSIGKIMWICIESLNKRGTTLNMKQQNIIERILEDVQNEQHQQHRVQQVLPKKAQQSKSSARKPRTVPNYAHISAIKIQAAYRGYRVLDPTMRPSIKEL